MLKDIMLMTHFIGLAMGLGAGIAMMFLAKVASKMDGEDGVKFMFNSLALFMMAKIGLTLLILSGIVLMMPYLSHMSTLPMFHVKLTLVAIFIGLVVVQSLNVKKAKQAGGGPVMMKIAKLGKMMLALVIMIVIFAVLAFH